MAAIVPLTDLPRALREHGAALSYQQCWQAVVAGDVPARRAGSRWIVEAADLPEIARTLSVSR
jgi:hypothetical protein